KNTMQRGAQFESQFRPHQVDDVAAQWAARRLQVASGIFRQVYNAVHGIDQDAGRRDRFDGLAVQGRFAERRAGADTAAGLRLVLMSTEASEQPRQQPRFGAGVSGRLIDARLPIDVVEKSRRVGGGLRRAEEQKSTRVERVVEGAAGLLLQFAVEIDQQIAAGDQVDAREWRIPEHAVACKQHDVAQFLADTVLIAFAREVTAQALLADVRFDGGWKTPLPRRGKRTRVEIGAEHLDLRPDFVACRFLEQQDRDRVGLFAGGTARDPHADRVARLLGLEYGRQRVGFERLEYLVVAEKRGDRDQQVGEQRLRLVGLVAQKFVIVLRVVHPGDLHAAGDPAQDGRALVLRKIVPGAYAQMRENAAHQLFVELAIVRDRNAVAVLHQFDQACHKLAHRQDEIRYSGRDRAARHRGVFGLVRILHQDDAAGFLDGPHADGTIGAGAGQNDREAVAVLFGQRSEKQVDRRALSARFVELRR